MKKNNHHNHIGDRAWLTQKKPPKMPKTTPIRIADLFCGCGGFTLGAVEACRLHNLDTEIALAIDSDNDSLGVFQSNFKSTNVLTSDICESLPGNLYAPLHHSELQLQSTAGNIDILLAGPPCQGHSNLNNKTRRNDPRNQLYLKAIRGVEVLKPKLALIENVTAVKHDKSGVVDQSVKLLEQLGYQIEIVEINANKLKVAQSRKRHFLVAYNFTIGSTLKDYLSNLNNREKKLHHVIADIIDEPEALDSIFCTPSVSVKKNIDRIQYLFDNNLYDLPNEQRPDCHKDKKHSYVSMYGRMKWDSPSQTITSGFGSIGQGRFIHPLRPRVITPHEAARIQGFPDFFKFNDSTSRSSLHRMIANAVPPPVSTSIITFFLDCLTLEEKLKGTQLNENIV